MSKRKILMVGIIFLLVISLIGFIFSQEALYCCEKTKAGAWCQNEPQENCDSNFQKAQTSCESTSYCKTGCCFSSMDGICSPNTAKKTCDNNGGTWTDNADCDIPQCEQGCCILGNSAFLSTLTACKYQSSLYGLETLFRKNIQSEFECITSVISDVKGACVFEEEFLKTCRITTRKECDEEIKGEFHQGYLCSAEKLGANCGPSQKTKCYDEMVYFIDTCGNLANIYDYNKRDDIEYWTEIISEDESCGYGKSNADSATCGNCDYLLGSTCKFYERRQDKSPKIGDYICRDLSCEYNGETYEHGEKWCAYDDEGNKGVDNNLPGSEHFIFHCSNNEITVIPCDPKRATICEEEEVVDGFMNAKCVANLYQNCWIIDNEDDCEEEEFGDCKWTGSKCVPQYPPGLDFWNKDSADNEYCEKGTSICKVTYKKGATTGWEWVCDKNCHCLNEEWKENANELCISMGDCGSSKNYLGKTGYYTINDFYYIEKT